MVVLQDSLFQTYQSPYQNCLYAIRKPPTRRAPPPPPSQSAARRYEVATSPSEALHQLILPIIVVEVMVVIHKDNNNNSGTILLGTIITARIVTRMTKILIASGRNRSPQRQNSEERTRSTLLRIPHSGSSTKTRRSHVSKHRNRLPASHYPVLVQGVCKPGVARRRGWVQRKLAPTRDL